MTQIYGGAGSSLTSPHSSPGRQARHHHHLHASSPRRHRPHHQHTAPDVGGEGLFQRVQQLAAAVATSEAATAEAEQAFEGAKRDAALAQAAQQSAQQQAALLEREVAELHKRVEAAEATARTSASRADAAVADSARGAMEAADGAAQIEQLQRQLSKMEAECAKAIAAASAATGERDCTEAAATVLKQHVAQLQATNASLQERAEKGATQLASARMKMEVGFLVVGRTPAVFPMQHAPTSSYSELTSAYKPLSLNLTTGGPCCS